MYRTRRPLPALVAAIGALAVAAPAAHAASDQSVGFAAGTVQAVEGGDLDNNVAFTLTPAAGVDVANLRLFVDTFNTGESYVSAGASGGVVVTPLKATSTTACQVHTGTAFPLSAVTNTGAALTFSIPKDFMRPQPRMMLVDGAAAGACAGVDGSGGMSGSFGGDETRIAAPWPWATPSAPVGLSAAGGPGSITLSWTPTGDTNGVHYQIVESGVTDPVAENVTGNSYTIDGLAPGVGHSYQVRAFRFWEGVDGRQFSAFTPAASAIAGAFPVAGNGGQSVRGASAGSRRGTAATLAAPKGLRARASRSRVTLTLPTVPKGSKLQIFRATGKKGGSFALKVTTSKRSWTDRKVKRGTTYRYRIVRVTTGGQLSVPSQTVTVRVPRR